MASSDSHPMTPEEALKGHNLTPGLFEMMIEMQAQLVEMNARLDKLDRLHTTVVAIKPRCQVEPLYCHGQCYHDSVPINIFGVIVTSMPGS